MFTCIGTHLLTESDLEDFHFKMCNVTEAGEIKKKTPADVVRGVIEFVRQQKAVDDLDALGKEIFWFVFIFEKRFVLVVNKKYKSFYFMLFFSEEEHKIAKFKQTVRYYLNGTEEHFMHYRKEVRGIKHCPLTTQTQLHVKDW